MKPYQMLIADDDRGFRRTLRLVLEPYFVLVEAASGEEAVDIIERRQIDIALLDMHMDELTGLETLRFLRSVNASAPGILITADATDDLRQDASEENVFSVLAKPVSKSELVTTVSTALETAYEDPDVFAMNRG